MFDGFNDLSDRVKPPLKVEAGHTAAFFVQDALSASCQGDDP